LPGKLADCSERDPALCELYLVEGDSAGGCFFGDTKVVLTDGRNITFKELVNEDKIGKKNYCYTIGRDEKIVIEEIKNPRITKQRAEVIKVLLDNNEEIICTPGHKFMLRDGSYKMAQDLTVDDSLMPLLKAVSNYNHKIKRIEKVEEKFDVYDIEVPGTHNFALAAGIFVHNSAKQGRDRRFQAILPLKGKIINVEKSRLDKVLSNDEIRTIVTALGTGVAEEFDIVKLRYHKIILTMDSDVDGSHIRTLALTLFYRQFPKLIENGYIYIAQPPLFKIKRGQREEYVQTEQLMDGMLLDLGREGNKFIRLKDKETFTDNKFKDLLESLVELEKLSRGCEKKGVNFAKYLSFRHPKTKKMPIYRVKVEGKDLFFYSDKELANFTDKENKEIKLDLLEFFEAQEIEQVVEKIEKLGLDIETYSSEASSEPNVSKGEHLIQKEAVDKASEKKPKPLYRISNEKEEQDLFALKEVLICIKEAATKGMHIQRYKGLGEMNPEQLWETTMDPEKRTLLKVTLEDTVEADKIFTVLMGDQVEPRRQFIEEYSHQVKNLDI
ncbi:MAG: toprim domain-containing protein, partial [Candidatus Omnitrophota bacterium]|nr:toprim domain-containing protein [Candidatus Omnitrophota bacterium]